MNVRIAVLVLALGIGPLAVTAAAAPPVRDTLATAVAGMFATDCAVDSDRCTDTSLLLFVDDGAARACLDIYTYTAAELLSYETGCAPVPEGQFSYDTKSLSGASISPTAITLVQLVCDATGCQPSGRPDRTVTVAATYTGVGEVSAFRANTKSTYKNCTFYFLGRGSQRDAEASAIIDGQSLNSFGFLTTSTQKSKVICR